MYAEQDFQLLEARTADVRVEIPWRKDRPYINPHAVFSRAPHAFGEQHEHITAVIGKNGTGKSHLLSAIVQTFLRLEEYQKETRSSISQLPLNLLIYRVDGHHCVVEQTGRRHISISVDGNVADPRDLPLPKRIVALTIGPFDKFPLPRTSAHSLKQLSASSSMYQYLGLRDHFGKASIRTLLFRSLNSLFDTTDGSFLRRSNIGAVFDFLGLRPTVNVVYRLRDKALLRDVAQKGFGTLKQKGLLLSQVRRLEDMARSDIPESTLQALADQALRKAVNGRVATRADLESGFQDPLFLELQPIRRAGFLTLGGVEVELKDGGPTDLLQASSGQLSMVSALIALASAINNGSLVLIDEPELSLHPEWQVKYIDLLIRTFARYQGCHFVVATHSPMVISELPAHADVISLDQGTLPPASELRGQSADYLLAEAFGLPTNGNLYVKERIVEALRLVTEGKAKSDAFSAVLNDLLKFVAELEADDPAKTIIQNLQDVADHAGTAV